MQKLPQIITENLNVKYADAVFELLKRITDSRTNDANMQLFMTSLCDNDGRSNDLNDRIKGTQKINEAYNKLLILQQKIVKRTFETAIMNYDTLPLDKYLGEMELLISKEYK